MSGSPALASMAAQLGAELADWREDARTVVRLLHDTGDPAALRHAQGLERYLTGAEASLERCLGFPIEDPRAAALQQLVDLVGSSRRASRAIRSRSPEALAIAEQYRVELPTSHVAIARHLRRGGKG